MRVLILVLSLDDGDLYTKFTSAQEETWDSFDVDGVDTIYYFGNNQFNNNECVCLVGNKLYTPVVESLENCGRKTLEAFEFIKDMGYDYVFRTNSSSYVDKSLLYDYLLDKPRNGYYSGVLGDFNEIKFASGAGYTISKDVLSKILKNKILWNHDEIDDVSLSILLNNIGITPVYSDRNNVSPNQPIWSIPINFFHYRLKNSNGPERIREIDIFYKIKKAKIDGNK